MNTYNDPAVRKAIRDHAALNEAYRRSAARELVATFILPDDDAYDQDAIVDALLEAAPYEREFNDITWTDFWTIAHRHAL